MRKVPLRWQALQQIFVGKVQSSHVTTDRSWHPPRTFCLLIRWPGILKAANAAVNKAGAVLSVWRKEKAGAAAHCQKSQRIAVRPLARAGAAGASTGADGRKPGGCDKSCGGAGGGDGDGEALADSG